MLLQKVKHESDKPGSGALLKIVLYLLSLTVAYLVGYYERPKTAPESVAPAPVAAAPTPSTPAEDAAAVPLSTPEPAVPSATPALIGAITPVRIEKAVAVIPAPTPAPAVTPAPQANQVTITEPVEIPVKDDAGKITGYINLQKGQLVTPLAVDHDQIKIKSGNSFVMVPIKSTDMAH